MPEEPATKAPPQISALLDTNILQYLNNPSIARELFAYLEEVHRAGYSLAISNFSIFELLSGVPKSKESNLISALEVIPRFEVTTEVLVAAAQLTTVYRMEKAEYGHITQGDKIIAATSLLNDFPVLTANSNDFPRPFFNELHKKFIFYKDKNRDRMIPVYLLLPDFDLVKFRYETRP